MSIAENSLVAAYQGRGQLKSRPSGTRVVTNRFKGMKIFSDSNETLIELFDISQKDVMNSITNDKLKEQALSSSQKILQYVCSWQNLDLNRETRSNMGSAQ